jgi:DNA-directed RNA polymerase specialized sigma24 family protein
VLRQDGSYAVFHERLDRQAVGGWLATYLLPTIFDCLLAASARERRVAFHVWLADTEAGCDGDLSDEALQRFLAENRDKLDRFLYNSKELRSYKPPSGKEIAARLGLAESHVTRSRQRVEAKIRESLQERWRQTRPGRKEHRADGGKQANEGSSEGEQAR